MYVCMYLCKNIFTNYKKAEGIKVRYVFSSYFEYYMQTNKKILFVYNICLYIYMWCPKNELKWNISHMQRKVFTGPEDSSYGHSILLLGWKPPLLQVQQRLQHKQYWKEKKSHYTMITKKYPNVFITITKFGCHWNYVSLTFNITRKNLANAIETDYLTEITTNYSMHGFFLTRTY